MACLYRDRKSLERPISFQRGGDFMRTGRASRPSVGDMRLPERITPAQVSVAGHVVSVVADASDSYAVFQVRDTTLANGGAGFELDIYEEGSEAPLTYVYRAKPVHKFDFDATGTTASVTWKNSAHVKSHAVGGPVETFFYGGPTQDKFEGGAGSNTFVGGTGYTKMRGSATSPNWFHEADGGSGVIVANHADAIFAVDDPGDPGYQVKYLD